MNVILFGYRGSGKTVVGRLTAQRLGWPFVDVDEEVRRGFGGMSIAEIWSKHGEPAFRQAEAQAVVEICRRDGQVIALGGGTLMQAKAREVITGRAEDLKVYLQAPPEILQQRIAADPGTRIDRPNLTTLGGGLEEIRAVLARRDPIYRSAANHLLEVTDLGPEAAAKTIAGWVRRV